MVSRGEGRVGQNPEGRRRQRGRPRRGKYLNEKNKNKVKKKDGVGRGQPTAVEGEWKTKQNAEKENKVRK